MRRESLWLALPMLVFASGIARADEGGRTISTSGEALIQVVPDEVQVGFGVEKFSKSLDTARKENEEASGRLVEALKDCGIEDKDIRTDMLEVDPKYNDRGFWLGIEGYYARRSYSVVLRDVKGLEKLIDAGLKSGANRLMGLEFRTTELRKHRDEARKKAIHAAKEKAEALAAELGCKVGKPRTIGEDGGSWYGSSRSWWGWNGGGYQQMSQNSISAAPSDGPTEGGDSLPLGRIGVRARVNVTFDLET